eukprot:CAMPEP_0205803252 /NCGR_PEP_ID=MMETSP0205-20121125/5853_1 /ASSEMBLY_ACC=CAM_ASM_000278 /TAXON_ID=36767 /ORGANISM="Euplotes focardii, Strain TN1" /LENGTH=241 /DNA_ID=CAMNT_0053071039 /DNA_START=6 /DNA_END=728 /DNA_ORIENTATION=+
MKPSIDKNTKLDRIESRNINDYNQRRAHDEIGREAWRKAQMMNTSTEQKGQMDDITRMKKLDTEFRQIEAQRVTERVNEVNLFDQKLKEDKTRQNMYRQMLSSQIQYNQGLKAYGNMTQIEKSMNKGDLKTYKSYDSNANNSSNPMVAKGPTKQQDVYGYGRYKKIVPTNNPVINTHATIPQSHSMNRSFTGNGGATPQKINNYRDNSAAPPSRRIQYSARGNPSERSLRNAGANSMSQDN